MLAARPTVVHFANDGEIEHKAEYALGRGSEGD